jgi:hypothetical protein
MSKSNARQVKDVFHEDFHPNYWTYLAKFVWPPRMKAIFDYFQDLFHCRRFLFFKIDHSSERLSLDLLKFSSYLL